MEGVDDDNLEFLGFTEWLSRLRGMDPLTLDEYYRNAHNNKKAFSKSYAFNCAVMDRFFTLGYSSIMLDEEDRKSCFEYGHSIANYIRDNFSPAQVEHFEKALQATLDLGQKFGNETMRRWKFESGIVDELGDEIEPLPERP